SYSMPDSINGLWGKPRGTAVWPILTKMSQVSRSARMYVFIEENDPRGYNMNSWVIDPALGVNSNMWADPLTVWHSSKSNFGYMDGHAETRKWSKETEELFRKSDETGAWGVAWGRIPKSTNEEEDLKWLLKGWPE
ncbi:MAG: hypothetical protein KAS23_03930, partial [Anaerohalosphaera sp.]|nr:hypothetical protein [Anaerohalosphaera sp.]